MAHIVRKKFQGSWLVRSNDIFEDCVFDTLKIENSTVILRRCRGTELHVRLGSVSLHNCFFEKITFVNAKAADFVHSTWKEAYIKGSVRTEVTNIGSGTLIVSTPKTQSSIRMKNSQSKKARSPVRRPYSLTRTRKLTSAQQSQSQNTVRTEVTKKGSGKIIVGTPKTQRSRRMKNSQSQKAISPVPRPYSWTRTRKLTSAQQLQSQKRR